LRAQLRHPVLVDGRHVVEQATLDSSWVFRGIGYSKI
jgi:hypothetical protein